MHDYWHGHAPERAREVGSALDAARLPRRAGAHEAHGGDGGAKLRNSPFWSGFCFRRVLFKFVFFFFRRTERNVRIPWGKPTSYEHVNKYNWKNVVR